MIREFRERLRQRHRSVYLPRGAQQVPARFRGLPKIDRQKCRHDCEACIQVCPTQAIARDGNGLFLDLGACLFCGDCAVTCQNGAIRFTDEYRMAARTREALVIRGDALAPAGALEPGRLAVLARSLKLREVSAGGCNACEAEVNVLSNVVFDLGRYGAGVVASPRHADGLLVTGPVPKNMAHATEETYRATPEPRVVIAVGACAISGGPFRHMSQCCKGATPFGPVDLYIPGCPPHPWSILDGLLRLVGKQKLSL